MIASGQRSRSASALTPGFRLSLGITLSVLAALVVLPLSALAFRAGGLGWEGFWAAALSEQALASYRLTLASSAAAAVCNGLFGLVTAWTLVRYRPPGRGLLDSLIDLPFAVPGAIGGLALAAMVGPGGLLGQVLLPLGIEIAYTRSAVFFALMYSGLPFVVRSVQPVIESLDPAEEEAAALLGASRGQVFFRIVLPSLLPALASGCLMAFIRGLGEFGTVVFI